MTQQADEVIKGDGYAVANLDGLGQGPGFRKIRRSLDVKEFGVNAIVMPPHYASGRHFHDRQEELYFVHKGKLEFAFGDGSTYELDEGGLARVDASTVREVRNQTDEEAVYMIVGAQGGYVGRDGRLPEDETPETAQRGRSLA